VPIKVANSSDRETNGRVSGRAGDLGGGLRPAASSFGAAPSGQPRRPRAEL